MNQVRTINPAAASRRIVGATSTPIRTLEPVTQHDVDLLNACALLGLNAPAGMRTEPATIFTPTVAFQPAAIY